MMIEDAELLRRYVASGDEQAFTELVQRHIDLVYSSALRQVGGDSHLASDVTQSVFLDLARKARSVAQHPVATGWLYASVRFAAINAVRRHARWRAREQRANAMLHEILRPRRPMPTGTNSAQ